MSTSVFDPADQENLDRKIAFGFERIAQVLKTLIWNQSKESGLSPIQIQFLLALHYGRQNDWTLSDLATYSQLTPATVSDALAALEQKNLIIRRQKQEDRRVSTILLTAAGRRQAAKLAGWMNAVQDAVAELDAADKAIVLKSLVGIIAALQREGLISIVQMCATCRYFRPHAHAATPKPHHCAFIDKPIGDGDLRLDCPDYEAMEVSA